MLVGVNCFYAPYEKGIISSSLGCSALGIATVDHVSISLVNYAPTNPTWKYDFRTAYLMLHRLFTPDDLPPHLSRLETGHQKCTDLFSILRFTVLPRDTMTWEQMGIEPSTLWSVDDHLRPQNLSLNCVCISHWCSQSQGEDLCVSGHAQCFLPHEPFFSWVWVWLSLERAWLNYLANT